MKYRLISYPYKVKIDSTSAFPELNLKRPSIYIGTSFGYNDQYTLTDGVSYFGGFFLTHPLKSMPMVHSDSGAIIYACTSVVDILGTGVIDLADEHVTGRVKVDNASWIAGMAGANMELQFVSYFLEKL